MSDLLAVVVQVQSADDLLLPGYLGRAVHALLLRWLDAYDAALAKRYHDADGPKPYTATTVIGTKHAGKDQRLLPAGQAAWLRLTALEPEVADALRQRMQHPPKSVSLDAVPIPVTGMTSDPDAHEWAGATSYEALSAPYLLARDEPPRHLRLAFAAPTTFKQNGMSLPVPLPDLVFGSLVDRWNAYSPVALAPEVRDYARDAVALGRYDLRSISLPSKNGRPVIGAKGAAQYTAVRYDRYWMSLLGLLADFALYAGVGRYTSTGMGQARRID